MKKGSSTYDTRGLKKAVKKLIKEVSKSSHDTVQETIADSQNGLVSFDEAEAVPYVEGNNGTLVFTVDDSNAVDDISVVAEAMLDKAEALLTYKVKEALK